MLKEKAFKKIEGFFNILFRLLFSDDHSRLKITGKIISY